MPLLMLAWDKPDESIRCYLANSAVVCFTESDQRGSWFDITITVIRKRLPQINLISVIIFTKSYNLCIISNLRAFITRFSYLLHQRFSPWCGGGDCVFEQAQRPKPAKVLLLTSPSKPCRSEGRDMPENQEKPCRHGASNKKKIWMGQIRS